MARAFWSVLAILATLVLATPSAIAAPRESVTFTNINSDGEYREPGNIVRSRSFVGGYPVARVLVNATLRAVSPDTFASESMIEVTAPDGTTLMLALDGDFGPDNRLTVAGVVFDINAPIPNAAGSWSFRFFEDFDDPGIDSVWETVTITLDDQSSPPPPPPPAENLGTIGGTPIELTRPLASGTVRWFRFDLPSGVSAPGFLDVSTAGSSLSGDPEAEANDTIIALYSAGGTLVASNDNESLGSLTSFLSFGAGSGGISLGQDGDLVPGTYYLAVGAYFADVGERFGFEPLSTAFGTISLSLRTTPSCNCTPLLITQQPADASAGPGQAATFVVGFQGSSPTIRWQKDGRDIPGATGPVLSFQSVQASDAGRYRAILTNCCSQVQTRDANLTVLCPSDFNGNGVTDFFDYLDFVSCFDASTCPPQRNADFDGNGTVDFFDYLDFVQEFAGNGTSFCACLIEEPPAAFDLLFDSLTPRAVTLTWDPIGPCEQFYEIDRSDDAGANFRRVAVVNVGTFVWTTTDLTPSTETRFRIRGCRFDGRSNACGPWSPVVVVRTPCEPPLAPSNVRVCDVWSTSVDVCWNAPAQEVSGFIVERSVNGVDFTPVAITSPTVTRHRVSGLTSGQLYVFRVSTLVRGAPGFADCITPGNTASATPDCVRSPTAWRVVSTTSSSVCLLWSDTSTCETRFVIQQSVWNGTTWGPAELGENVPPNRDNACRTGLSSQTRYRFRIRAEIEGVRTSAWSDWVEAQTGADCLQPPTNFRVSSVSGNQVCLLWTDTSSCEDRFVIEQSVWNGSSWGPWVFGENVPPNRGDACRTALSYSTRYRFRVRAEITGSRVSGWSPEIEATTGSDCLQPPGNFRVSSVSGNQICLLWNDTSSCETRFVIEQARWNGSAWDAWTLGENAPGNRGDACRTGLAYATLYKFRIRAEIEGSRVSAWSQEIQATTQADCLQPPGNFRVASVSGNQICFLWNDTSSCETRFVIEQARWNGSTWDAWTLGENVPGNRGDACRTGLAYATLYKFRIRAEIEGSRTSAWSQEVQATTQADCLQTPGNFRVTARGCGTVTLAWTDTSSCETRFVIEQSDWNGSTWDPWTFGENVPPNATTAVRTGLAADGLYRFRIRAEIEGVRASDWTTNNPEGRATPDCLDRPTSFRSGVVTPTSVELLWNDNSSCEDQFQIYQRRFTNGAWGSWQLGENVPANAERAIRDSAGTNPLVRGGRYQFYVIADRGSCESQWSNVVEVDLPN